MEASLYLTARSTLPSQALPRPARAVSSREFTAPGGLVQWRAPVGMGVLILISHFAQQGAWHGRRQR